MVLFVRSWCCAFKQAKKRSTLHRIDAGHEVAMFNSSPTDLASQAYGYASSSVDISYWPRVMYQQLAGQQLLIDERTWDDKIL